MPRGRASCHHCCHTAPPPPRPGWPSRSGPPSLAPSSLPAGNPSRHPQPAQALPAVAVTPSPARTRLLRPGHSGSRGHRPSARAAPIRASVSPTAADSPSPPAGRGAGRTAPCQPGPPGDRAAAQAPGRPLVRGRAGHRPAAASRVSTWPRGPPSLHSGPGRCPSKPRSRLQRGPPGPASGVPGRARPAGPKAPCPEPLPPACLAGAALRAGRAPGGAGPGPASLPSLKRVALLGT